MMGTIIISLKGDDESLNEVMDTLHDSYMEDECCNSSTDNYVAGLKERIKALEAENAELRLQLARARETLKDEAGEQYGCS
jgi:hypothetical protein